MQIGEDPLYFVGAAISRPCSYFRGDFDMLDHLRTLREDRDLSQADLARVLHIHQTTYSDYELGNLNIPIPVLKELALYFDTSVDYLLGLTNHPEPYPRA